MAIKLDQIIVVDIEATCWDGSIPPGQESEIIERGSERILGSNTYPNL